MNDSILQTISDAAAFLTQHRVPFAIIGGIAVGARGEPRFTADLDAVIDVDIDRAVELIATLRESPFRPLFPDADAVLRKAYILALRHRSTGIKVDLAIGLSGFERGLIQRAQPVTFGTTTVPVAITEDLLLMKVLAGRPRDVTDAEGIALRHGEKLDWPRILALGAQLEEAVEQDLLTELRRLERLSVDDNG